MKRLTFTKYFNTNKLFYPLQGSIAVISFKAIFQDPEIITLPDEAMILLNSEKTEKNAQKFMIQPGSYTFSQLSQAISEKIPQVKITNENELKTVILSVEKGYTATISQNLLTLLGFNIKTSDKLTGKYIVPPSIPKVLPKKVSLYCEEIDGIFNEIDGQPSQQLCSIDVDNNTASCSPINPIFLPFLSNEPVYNLHFKLYDENENEIIPKTFFLMLYNKQ